jgi:hypothetical protein
LIQVLPIPSGRVAQARNDLIAAMRASVEGLGEIVTFYHHPGRASTRTKRCRSVHGGELLSDVDGLTVDQQVEASRIFSEARRIRDERCKLRHVRLS